jgi:hypothetical protein
MTLTMSVTKTLPMTDNFNDEILSLKYMACLERGLAGHAPSVDGGLGCER